MQITWDAIVALLAMLFVTRLPLPSRAEGLRIGFFGAAMAYVFFDAVRGSRRQLVAVPMATGSVEEPVVEEEKPLVAVPVELPPVADEDRIGGMDLLTGFSILRYLRRTGAVTDTEYEAKKQDLLHRA